MITDDRSNAIIVLGEVELGGTYALRISVRADICLRFGRYKNGALFDVLAGEYIYIGSALSNGQTPNLAYRLVRHATRSANRRTHQIHSTLVRYFEDQKFIAKGSLCGKQKNLFWHVDYLLDHLDAEIKSVYIIYGHRQIETTLASWLEIQPQTCVIDKGLGASDDPGRTHLLFVDANEGWWQDLSHTIINLINIAGEKRNSHVERE